MLTKLVEKEIELRVLDLLKAASMVDVDTFIDQATKIADKVKRNPNLSIEAKQEARVLLRQLEEYMEAHTFFRQREIGWNRKCVRPKQGSG